jgi:hypothetical protein
MAKTTTTLAGAVGASDLAVGFAAADNPKIRAGDNIVVGTESMKALIVDPALGATVVYRGNRGTALGTGVAYNAGAAASFGPPSDWGPLVGVAMVPLEFEAEAKDEVAAEDAEKLAERVEKKRKELEAKAVAKAAADAKAAEAAEKAAEKAADKAEKNDRTPAPTHR